MRILPKATRKDGIPFPIDAVTTPPVAAAKLLPLICAAYPFEGTQP
jgi:hypothetical protein